jgi:hypothetical protein
MALHAVEPERQRSTAGNRQQARKPDSLKPHHQQKIFFTETSDRGGIRRLSAGRKSCSTIHRPNPTAGVESAEKTGIRCHCQL